MNQLPFSRFCFLFVLFTTLTIFPANAQQPIILDADTGNEIDDLFAVARALIEPSWEITALNATQWQTSHWAEPQSMENSHRVNAVLTGYLKHPAKLRRGGIARMFDWGDKAQHSAAAYEIIKQAKAMPAGEKLTVIALGALTNVASAIYIDPSIEPLIKLYWLGTNYDFEAGLMDETDFNSVMDVQALDIMLKSVVEMHVMPHSVALAMEFTYEETERRLRDKHDLGKYLVDRWYNHLDGLREARWIWDLALIGAMIHPEWAERVEITTSPENGNRKITYYRAIDGEKIRNEFFETLNAHFENQ
ncbi:MAG: nucleoside hydrolase [Bacteroidota bacterium]